jgi:uncharacterized protein (TIGR04255 family)
MSGFEPLHDAHAIEQVAMALQFAGQVDDAAFSEILIVADAFKEELPRPTDFAGIQIMFPGQQVALQPPMSFNFANAQSVPMGRSFAKFRANGSLESELRLDRSTVTYRTSAYTTWREVWRTAKAYFDKVIPTYAKAAQPASISLNYLDKFRWKGSPQNVRVGELLRVGSPYVTPHVFGLDDMWHSHTGAFLRIDEATKRLVNINVDCIDDLASGTPQRTIAIATVLTDMLNQPSYVATVVDKTDLVAFFDAHLKLLHDVSKQIFGQTIGDDMCKRIALFPGT